MATVTLTTLATAAVEDLGVLDAGGALSPSQLAQALTAANTMLDNWSSQKLLIARSLLQTFTLANGTQDYTIGPALTFNVTPAPVKIVAATLLNSAGPSSPIEVLNAVQWSRLSDRQAVSFLVKHLFYDRAVTGKVYFSPVPSGSALTVQLAMWVAMAQFVDAITLYTLIPGYQQLMQFGLAMVLAPKYGRTPSPQLKENYEQALAAVASLNAGLLGPDDGMEAVAAPQPAATP
jgi:hypothetical protein